MAVPKNIYEVIAARKEAAGQRQVSRGIEEQYFPKEKKTAPEYTGPNPEGYAALKKKTAPKAAAEPEEEPKS